MHYFIAEPIYNYAGRLYAVEILTRFEKSETTNNREIIFSKMSAEDKLTLFIEQIGEINQNASFFSKHGLLCSINIDYLSLKKLCSYRNLAENIFSIPYLRLELNEKTTPLEIRHIYNLTEGLRLPDVQDFFWLDDFSRSRFSPAGYLTWGQQINFIKIDRSLLLKNQHVELCYQVGIIKNRNCAVLVEGVETQKLAEAAFCAGADFVQGYLFPHKKLSDVRTIPLNVNV